MPTPLCRLDQTDRKLAYLLSVNSRTPLKTLSSILRLSPSAVFHRQKRLERAKMISGYQTVINMPGLGLSQYRVYAKLSAGSASHAESIAKKIARMPFVYWLGTLEGSWDFALTVLAKDNFEFNERWAKVRAVAGGSFHEWKVSAYTSLEFFSYAFLSEKARPESDTPLVQSNEKIAQLSDAERLVLKRVSDHANESTYDVAKATGLDPKTVYRAWKSLESKKVILGYRAIVQTKALGMEYYKVDVNLRDFSMRGSVLSWLRECPNVVYIDNSTGGSDAEFDLIVDNHSHYKKVMAGFLGKFGRIVESYEFFLMDEVYKIAYYP